MISVIRPATVADAAAISAVVIGALRESNARDYSADIIEQVQRSFSPAAVEQLIALREVYVATLQDQVVATASLDGGVVRSVFVSPDFQRRGFGQQLMRKLEAVAQARGLGVLSVPSSITAQAFYQRLGFSEVRDEFHGSERTIIMQKTLR